MYYSNYIINHSIIPDKRLVQHVAANVVKLLVPVPALRLGAVRELYSKRSARLRILHPPVYCILGAVVSSRRCSGRCSGKPHGHFATTYTTQW